MSLKIQILSEQGVVWVNWAKQQLKNLTDLRIKYGMFTKNHIYLMPDGIYVWLCSSSEGDVIKIWGDVSGFICHPRSDNFPGGITPTNIPISTIYIYPLVDNDHGSSVLSKEDTELWKVKTDPENYGNIDWVGVEEDIISFRGSCGRQLAMDDTSNYPGFTEFDYEDSSFVEHYTPFKALLYQEGDATEYTQYKVVGAGKYKNALVTILSKDYMESENPAGGRGGFYDEVWINGKQVGYVLSSRPKISWFFNSSGNKAVHENTELTITDFLDKNNNTIYSTAFNTLPSGDGTQISIMDPHSGVWSVQKSGLWTLCRDYYGDTEKSISWVIHDSQSSDFSGTSSDTHTALPIMWSGTETYVPIVISGPEDAVVGYDYDFTGGVTFGCEQTVHWSFDGGTISASGTLLTVNGCGSPGNPGAMGTVTVTLQPSGMVGHKEVRMPNGVWVTLSNCVSGCTGYSNPGGPCDWPVCGDQDAGDTGCKLMHCDGSDYTTVETISGDRKYVETWGVGVSSQTVYGCTAHGDPPTCSTIPDYGNTVYLKSQSIFEWRCP